MTGNGRERQSHLQPCATWRGGVWEGRYDYLPVTDAQWYGDEGWDDPQSESEREYVYVGAATTPDMVALMTVGARIDRRLEVAPNSIASWVKFLKDGGEEAALRWLRSLDIPTV